jgi:hypothetical protein
MSTTQHASVPQVFEGLGEVERQIRLWNMEAVQLGRSLEAFAIALRVDPSRIDFRGDLIALEGDQTSSEVAVSIPSGEREVIVDLAKIRNLVCNMKILQAQRKELQGQRRKFRRAV